MHANLNKKNAEIYIKRSRALRMKNPPRSRLMEASMTSVRFHILSDTSMLQEADAIQFIKDVDTAAWPEDLRFSAIYYKWFRFESKTVLLKLRDFVQPFLDVKNLLTWGKIVLAEQSPNPRAIRKQRLRLNHPELPDVVIKRSVHSFKVYRDVAMDMDYFVFSHGPCWEPVIAQVNLTMSYITGLRKADPSPPLSWWDKLRYLMHGRLLCRSRPSRSSCTLRWTRTILLRRWN